MLYVFLSVFQATVVCDLVLLYVLPKREFYKNMKYKYTDTHQQVSFEKSDFFNAEHQEAAERHTTTRMFLDSSAFGAKRKRLFTTFYLSAQTSSLDYFHGKNAADLTQGSSDLCVCKTQTQQLYDQ